MLQYIIFCLTTISTMSSPTRGTKFTFTDFGGLNWQKLFDENQDFFRYLAWGEEVCPKTGRKHNQGFLQLFTTRRFSAIKKICNYPGLHLEVMRGTFAENQKYCEKEGKYTKCGAFVKQGQRTDLEAVIDDIKSSDGNKATIIENHPEVYMKFHGGIDKICAHWQQKAQLKWQEVTTTVLCGAAGTGKTSAVYKKHGYENVFTLDSNADSKFLLDGYGGEDVLLIDDFNGTIKYSTMLRLLDGHPMKLNVKGGRVYKAWTKVYITSNVTPSLWYNDLGQNLIRRLDSCHEVANRVILKPISHNLREWVHRWDSYQ